jgi:hypothetical protein
MSLKNFIAKSTRSRLEPHKFPLTREVLRSNTEVDFHRY